LGEEVLNYSTTYPLRHATRSKFGWRLKKVQNKAVVPVNMISGFKETGICPSDPEVILCLLYVPTASIIRAMIAL
jgi:hypothetical protein